MKTRSASSRSAARATTKKRDTSTRATDATATPAATITAAEFDRLANLPPDDPAGDLEPYMDWEKAVRPGRTVQRVNVDFPIGLLRAIDQAATRIGVTRQAFIKLRLADTVLSPTQVSAGPMVKLMEALRTVMEEAQGRDVQPLARRAK